MPAPGSGGDADVSSSPDSQSSCIPEAATEGCSTGAAAGVGGRERPRDGVGNAGAAPCALHSQQGWVQEALNTAHANLGVRLGSHLPAHRSVRGAAAEHKPAVGTSVALCESQCDGLGMPSSAALSRCHPPSRPADTEQRRPLGLAVLTAGSSSCQHNGCRAATSHLLETGSAPRAAGTAG